MPLWELREVTSDGNELPFDTFSSQADAIDHLKQLRRDLHFTFMPDGGDGLHCRGFLAGDSLEVWRAAFHLVRLPD